MTLPATSGIPFGGEYNPEQWPEPVWDRDYRLFDQARIDTVTLGVFAWAHPEVTRNRLRGAPSRRRPHL